MKRFTVEELERRCQKPDYRRVGNWMARRITRPAALRITWVIAPCGVSANMATAAAWACSVAAAFAFGWGTVAGWLVGAGLLNFWYLLDHVDGQLARLRGTSSLDGVQLDYLMHHTTNLLVPAGVGWGLFCASAFPPWILAGLAWGTSLLLIGLEHDTRYKSFYQRLKRLRGDLRVVGGGGGRPAPQPPAPCSPVRLVTWTARKLSEIHVMMTVLSVLAFVALVTGDRELAIGRAYLLVATSAAALVAVSTIARSQQQGRSEREFATWYRVPDGYQLTFRDGWWHIHPAENEEDGGNGQGPSGRAKQSS